VSGGRLLRFVPLGLYFAQWPLYSNYLTDDTYIYAQFARNLARHGELVFQRGEWVHAATSPLWAGIGSIGILLGLGAFFWLKLGSIVCGALCVWWMTVTCERVFPSRALAVLAACALAVEPWFVRWSMSGMETALAALCVVAVLRFGWQDERESGIGWAALAAGLGPLIRPELLLFLALFALRVAFSRVLRRRAAVWLALSMPLLAWTAIAMPTYGTIWPETAQAKSTPLGLVGERLLGNLRSLFVVLAVAVPVAGLAAVASAVRAVRLRRMRTWLEPVLWAWVVLLPAAYLLRDVFAVSRYYEIMLPFVLFLGAAELLGRRWGVRLWVLQMLFAVGLTTFWISPSVRAFSSSIDAALGDIAGWLRENTDADDMVAIYDIGIVGFRSERPILDLGGLIQPDLNEIRDRIDDEEIVRRGLFLNFGNPSYLVHRAPVAAALAGAPLGDRVAEPILSREVSNLGLRQPEPVQYTLYRLLPLQESSP